MPLTFYFIATLLLLIILSIISIYNALVKKDNLTKEAWSGIDVQLKKRYDLIPSLVDTVKGYAKHEKSTLEDIVNLRNAAHLSKSIDERIENENQLSGMLKNLFALSEAYPDLKSNQNFSELQSSLQKVEEDLQLARRYYNATVREFNTLVSVFPSNLIAKKFGFSEKEFFGIEDNQERANVKVSF